VNSPRQQAREQSVHIRGDDEASTGRVSAAATGMDVPQTDRESEHAAATGAPLPGNQRGNKQAMHYPIHGIAVNVMPSFSFPVHIRHNQVHVLL
jgi:hypothetical protein